MQASNSPDKITLPFAESGAKQTIPVDSQIGIEDGRASYTDGFPPVTRTPISAGGVPPFGTDFNGLFYAITNLLRWQNGGGFFKFDQSLSDAIGGYPQGAKLVKADGYGFWESLVDDNTDDPDVDNTNWQLLRAQDVGYDNNTSGLAADQVQAAVDEIVEKTLDVFSQQSLTARGYQELPGGAILQWGDDDIVNDGIITFPVAFPTNVLNISVTEATSGSTGSLNVVGVKADSFDATQFRARNDGASTSGFWYAIGH